MKVLAIVLSFLFISSTVDAQKIRKKKEHYDNGQLKSIGDYDHTPGFFSNRNRGLWKFYHENGQLESTGNYGDYGTKEGVWKYYYDSGQLSAIENYGYGNGNTLTGTWKKYHENGQLSEIGDYKSGHKDGEWKEYYKNGQLRSVKYYQENYMADLGLRWESQKDGTWKYYYEDGSLKQVGVYDEGQKTGMWTWYRSNGKLEAKGEYLNDVRIGIWKYYDENGNQNQTEDYDYIDGRKYFTDGPNSTNLDGETSLRMVQNSANNGNADAQYLLGVLYYNGEGVGQDLSKAISLFKKSADGGNSNARFNLGAMYETGIGVTQNQEQALHWYKEALKTNPDNTNALHNLGAHYINKGAAIDQKANAVPADDDDTYNELIAEANKEYSLALPYLLNYLELKSDDEAVQQAVNSIHDRLESYSDDGGETAYQLGQQYSTADGVSYDPNKAFHYYKKGAESGHVEAQYETGWYYAHGIKNGIDKDWEQALYWYKKSAENGSAKGMYGLGQLYYDGLGQENRKNMDEAALWLKKALENERQLDQTSYNNTNYFLARVFIDQGDELYDQAQSFQENSKEYDELVQEAMGYYREGLPYLNKTIELKPNNYKKGIHERVTSRLN